SLLGSEQDLEDSLEGSISRWQDGLLYGNKVTAWRAEEAELLRQVRSQAGAWERGQNDGLSWSCVLVAQRAFFPGYAITQKANYCFGLPLPKGGYRFGLRLPKGQLFLSPAQRAGCSCH